MYFKEKVRGFDVFGAPVSLTYKGDSSFKTVCGGLVCILITILIGVAAIGELVTILTSNDYQ